MTDGSPSDSRAASAGSQSKIDIPRLRAEIASTGVKVAAAGAKSFGLWLDGLKD